jgi:hypothetical protein
MGRISDDKSRKGERIRTGRVRDDKSGEGKSDVKNGYEFF